MEKQWKTPIALTQLLIFNNSRLKEKKKKPLITNLFQLANLESTSSFE